MWTDPRTKAIWNRLGLNSTNGVVILPMATFEKALELARIQAIAATPSDKEGGG